MAAKIVPIQIPALIGGTSWDLYSKVTGRLLDLAVYPDRLDLVISSGPSDDSIHLHFTLAGCTTLTYQDQSTWEGPLVEVLGRAQAAGCSIKVTVHYSIATGKAIERADFTAEPIRYRTPRNGCRFQEGL